MKKAIADDSYWIFVKRACDAALVATPRGAAPLCRRLLADELARLRRTAVPMARVA